MVPPDRLPSTMLPGADLVAAGLVDVRAGRHTEAAMLVADARQRLMRLGYHVPEVDPDDPDGDLYELIEARVGSASAHGAYDALRRRMVSFLRSETYAPTDR